MKGKKTSTNTDLAQKHSENTQFLSFLHEDFLSKSSSKDGKSKLAIETKEFLIHVTAQYKSLLELPPLVFWSTMNHNAYVNRSLDSFLSFARRWHFCILDLSRPNDNPDYEEELDYDTLQVKKHLHVYFNELYRVVLCIYDRLASDPLNKSIEHKIQYSEVIYQNWLFDIPKFLDICALYYQNDSDRVRKILDNVFEIEDAYHSDFLDFIGDLTDNILPNNLKIINRHRKREDLDSNTINSDTDEKERILIVLYDVIYHLKLISLCFPKKCVEALYYDKKFLLMLENMYMVLNSCTKTWRVREDRQTMLRNLAMKVNNMVFRIFERVYTNVFGNILLAGPNDKISKDKKLWSTVNDYLNQTGKTLLKKKDEEPNHKFLRKLMRYVDFGAILQKVPSGVLKEEDIETHQVLLMVLREKTDMLKKKFAPVNDEEAAKEQSSENAAAEQVANANVSPVKEMPKEIKMEKKPSVIDKDAEGTKEAIKIIEMTMGKKNKAFNVFDDEDEMREVMAATLKLAANTNVYEDEYDDTLEMYEEDRLRVGGDKADENEDDDDDNVDIEGAVKPEEGGGRPGGYKGKRGGHEKGPRNEGQRGNNQGKGYEEKGKGGRGSKDQQYQGDKRDEERKQEGYKYQGNKYGDDRGGYKGDRYQGDRREEERQEGYKYQSNKYGDDRGGYKGDRNQGDRYQGNRYDDNKGPKDSNYRGGGAYGRNERLYQEKTTGKDSVEEESNDPYSKRDTYYKGGDKGLAAEFQRGGGSGGPFDQKKQNRNTYNDRQKYKGGQKSHNEKEYVAKK